MIPRRSSGNEGFLFVVIQFDYNSDEAGQYFNEYLV